MGAAARGGGGGAPAGHPPGGGGRRGGRGARVDTAGAVSAGAGALADARRRAAGGTLVVEGLPGLPAAGRRVAARLIETAARRDDVLVLAVVDPLDPEGGLPAARPGPRERLSWWPGTRLELPTLSERGDDVRGLVEHLLRVTSSEAGAAELTTAPEVVAALVAEARARRIESVGELRHLVRDVVFDTFAGRGGPGVLVVEDVAQALGSGHGAGQADATPYEVPAAVDADTLRRLAVIHSVPERVLAQQVTVLQQVIAGLDDAPRSYTNILERAEDIKRVALWLWAGADSQADFRKAFGPQRHMQPSKSVSWAFYNRVFKREV